MPAEAPARDGLDAKELLQVLLAVKKGNFSARMPVDYTGVTGKVADALNDIIEMNARMAQEFERLGTAVGKEGKTLQRANLPHAAGGWAACVDSVNTLVGDLVQPIHETARVIGAVAQGDLTQYMALEGAGGPLKGEFLRTAKVVNGMVDQLSAFAVEVTRVAREVGSEGKLGGQAVVKGVAGTWKDLTDSVNSMAGNLTAQVRNIADVTTAVANGDLSKKITVDVRGEILQLKDTINTMVDQLRGFAAEVTRVAREVGTEGKLGGQAVVLGVGGTWKELTDSVNSMASNLTAQVRNIAFVTTAVAKGDLAQKITVEVQGEILELKDTINTMVEQLRAFSSEVTRVAREVGTEGKLGGQAAVPGVAGTWKDLTDNVNFMASNLTTQVRNIAEVTTAVANGNLTKKITVDVKGEILELKNTINTMVDQLNAFAGEVTRVAREVGTEGKLGGQASVKGVAGTWKDLTDSVNSMAGNLTSQVRNIAEVTTAVANGNLNKKITVDVKGEILELKDTINTMVDQLNAFAGEVTRVAREVGTEGKLGGQAVVRGVGGTWKDLTDNVNLMANNLTGQVRNIAEVTTAVANGNLTKKITVDVKGEILELKNTINTMVDQLNAFAGEVTRVAREVGTEGKLGGQASVTGVAGTWKDLTDNVNQMANNLTLQVRNVAEVTTAVASGDLSKKITVDVKGEMLQLKNTINTMVDQLNAFASEVTRVAREVGTEGKLGGQATVKGVAGTWKDLTDNVNFMAVNLTTQVRGIAKVVTAVANGDLKRKLVLEAKGEIAELAETINSMIDTLAVFGDQVTTVAREVGIEGKLGGQASVPGAAGLWRNLTDNVNQLAGNLTTQVRAIGEVATAVAQGDLTRSITVEAAGEVAMLKDNINEMIRNLKETTTRNTEQDWLKTNLAKFTRNLQGQRDTNTLAKLLLSDLAPLVRAQHGVFYMAETGDTPNPNGKSLRLLASYGFKERQHVSTRIKLGEGLVGQAALEQERILLTNVPKDYIKVSSGLGEATPANIVVLPVVFEGEIKAVVELASLDRFNDINLAFLEQLSEGLGILLNTIAATQRTEELLKQSQALAEELQSQQEELTESNQRLAHQTKTLQASEELLKTQQEELQQANEELSEKARLLAEQKNEVERKNNEVEQARRLLEERAEQLALTSKYKSQFLANMSHELRTPLNSLLILSKKLADNEDGNLHPKQVEYSQIIHGAGSDLLALISEILDLSKIESGTMAISVTDLRFDELQGTLERNFRQVAEAKGLGFTIALDPKLPQAMRTDAKRLQQVLKNLLSNAFKFTEQGTVGVRIRPVTSGFTPGHEVLSRAKRVVALSVSDSGIGIPADKQQSIFEAFQQLDGTTSRKYGGTGLGLSISREIARMLGGEIRVQSEEAQGSTFTLYVPLSYVSPPKRADMPAPAPGTRTVAQSRFTPSDSRTVPMESTIPEVAEVPDDRQAIVPGDRVLLIVEDDPHFARILLDMARERGFRGVVAADATRAIKLGQQLKPDAITLDLRLASGDGWTVLDRLKHDPGTRHIPVHVISVDESRARSIRSGAVAFLQKPATKESLEQAFTRLKDLVERTIKHLLIVEDDEVQRQSIVELIGNADVHATAVGTGKQALAALKEHRFDCMVLDLRLPDMPGTKLIEKMKSEAGINDLPIIVYTGKDLTRKEESELNKVADAIIIKDVKSPERLLDETALFLHRVEANLPTQKRRMLDQVHRADPAVSGRKVLIVDDDVRNIFALTAVFERYGMQIASAETGKEALDFLEKNDDVDAILMDVMMPEMDGYETTRAIRSMERFQRVPIIALTAKAMMGDREKCIEAGASDYIAKPADADQLLSLLRVWLYTQP